MYYNITVCTAQEVYGKQFISLKFQATRKRKKCISDCDSVKIYLKFIFFCTGAILTPQFLLWEGYCYLFHADGLSMQNFTTFTIIIAQSKKFIGKFLHISS